MRSPESINFIKIYYGIYLHILVLAWAFTFVIQKTIGVGRFDHLNKNGRDLTF